MEDIANTPLERETFKSQEGFLSRYYFANWGLRTRNIFARNLSRRSLLGSVYLALDEGGEVAFVALLEIGQLPVVGGDQLAAGGPAARAFEIFAGGAIDHGVIDADFFADLDGAHGADDDLAVEAGISIAAMVDPVAGAGLGGDEMEAVFDLGALALRLKREIVKFFGGDDVPTPHGDELVFGDRLAGEHSPAFDGFLLTDLELGREPGVGMSGTQVCFVRHGGDL